MFYKESMTKVEAIERKQELIEQRKEAYSARMNALTNGGVVEYNLQNGEDRRSVRMLSALELTTVIKELEKEIAVCERIISSYEGRNGMILGGIF